MLKKIRDMGNEVALHVATSVPCQGLKRSRGGRRIRYMKLGGIVNKVT